ncbi:hypothetical protein GCM10020229_64580 [Kitasatospora albolonga]
MPDLVPPTVFPPIRWPAVPHPTSARRRRPFLPPWQPVDAAGGADGLPDTEIPALARYVRRADSHRRGGQGWIAVLARRRATRETRRRTGGGESTAGGGLIGGGAQGPNEALPDGTAEVNAYWVVPGGPGNRGL